MLREPHEWEEWPLMEVEEEIWGECDSDCSQVDIALGIHRKGCSALIRTVHKV